jgi:hypothetical protein
VPNFCAHPLSDGWQNQENEGGLAERVEGVKVESHLIFHIFCGGFRTTGSSITASHQTAVRPTDNTWTIWYKWCRWVGGENWFLHCDRIVWMLTYTFKLLLYQNRIMKSTFSSNDPHRLSNLGSRGAAFLEGTARLSVRTGCFDDISRGLKHSRLEM